MKLVRYLRNSRANDGLEFCCVNVDLVIGIKLMALSRSYLV
jgi:hypothetical protein